MQRSVVNWRIFALTVSVASLLAWISNEWLGLGFWWALAIILVAILINGVVAAVEDELPGGFNNPRPSDRKDRPS
jgi:hypothetical protein